MATFKVYPYGNGDAEQQVEAPSARRAAEEYWAMRVLDGDAGANEEERVVVEHADGPNADPSARWRMKEGRLVACFDVSVMRVEVSAIEAK